VKKAEGAGSQNRGWEMERWKDEGREEQEDGRQRLGKRGWMAAEEWRDKSSARTRVILFERALIYGWVD